MPPQRVLMEGIDTVLSDLDDIESFLSGKKKDKTHKEEKKSTEKKSQKKSSKKTKE